jgi:hypothetical protein
MCQQARISLLIAFFFLVLSVQAQALTVVVDPSIATASAIAPGAIIQSDLRTHVWSVHPTFGYFSGSSNADGSGAMASSNGWGGTLDAEYSYNEHVGINFSGLGYKGSGAFTPGAGVGEGGTAGTTNINGWLVGASLVLDPFSGEGFRMPFFFGVNYEHIASSTPTSGLFTAMTLNSPGYTLGFSPRFNIGFLRFEPFLVSVIPSGKGNVTCAANVEGGVCGSEDVQILPVFGVNIVFRPWGIAFYFNLSSTLFGTGVSFYSLGPQLTF